MKVGIYFKIDNEFLRDAVPVADGEPYGVAIQHGGHNEFHELLVPATLPERRFKSHDYDYYPRGRVVFFPATNIFRIYIDPCLGQDDIQRLIELFELAAAQIETATDEHYRCARCNKAYVA
jgi:hypothetical protein